MPSPQPSPFLQILPFFQAYLRRTTFRHQFTLAVALVVLLITLCGALASSWQGSRQIRSQLKDQGQRVAENLAAQSPLALLYDSTENVDGAVGLTLSFPDVVQVEIRHVDGRLLLVRSLTGRALPAAPIKPDSGPKAYLEAETSDNWRFVAPVYSRGEEPSPFAVVQAEPKLLGHARVIVSKARLHALQLQVFATNLAMAIFFAILFLLLVNKLTSRLTRPLQELAVSMERAERGETTVRARLDGPSDIVHMAQAFNSMISALDQREQELRLARDEAVRFGKLKAEFAATLGHEIRTPLNGVVGTLDLLRSSGLPAKPRDFVRMAWDSAQYLLQLVNNVLDFSRLEAGRLDLEHIEVDVREVVERVIDFVAPQAHQKGLEVGALVDADVPARIMGDPHRLSQVLINLVGNAIKFTESGEVSIRVSLAATPAPEGMFTLRFSVIDTGIGISEEARERIFDSFAQADTSTTRRFGGSGLGLAIARQLVVLMGGYLDVESTPGQGSRFWFTAQLAAVPTPQPEAPLPDPALPDPALPGTAVPDTAWAGRRVLVVDDGEIVPAFLQQTLGGWGLPCDVAPSAEAALGKLTKALQAGQPYALAIMDEGCVPHAGETGAAGRMLAALAESGSLCVFMNRLGTQLIPVTVQVDGWLTKPLRRDRLLECLAELRGETLQEAAPLQAQATPPARRCRVLVAEDNGVNQAVAQNMLSMLGCEVRMTDTGLGALQAFREQTWDIILMDCNMPEMDGYDATAAIRALESENTHPQRQTRVPIVAMTANTRAVDIEKCLAAGMDDHLGKPVSLASLSAMLSKWHGGLFVATAQEETSSTPAPPGYRLPPSTPIDPGVLETLREALGGAIGQAIKPFLEDMPGYLEELDQAYANEDLECLRRAAHAIKGAASNLGAVPLSATARDIEALAEAGNLEAIQPSLGRMHAEYAMVRPPLLAALKTDLSRPIDNVAEGALVLVVDDDRSTRAALRFALQRAGFQVQEATDGQQALAAVERLAPDLILMDAMMPAMDGFTACARLKDNPFGKDVPVLMITALEDAASIERAFAVGAVDYVPKPIHYTVLNQRIRRVIEATRAERHVRHLAYNDIVTGLPNRIQFTDHLNGAIKRAGEHGQSMAVLFLDLNRFKFVNDTLGHHNGDRLLKMVAQRIRHSVRANDTVARLGGDEFTILLSDLPDTKAAASAAAKVEQALSTPFHIDGHDLFISTSIGISLFPEDGLDMNTLLRHADTAMYRAKRENTGFQFYEHGMEERISEHLKLESALRRALERDELVVYYQPEVETGSGRLVGMEALVRWKHGTRGLVSPAEFIPLAEETGMIVQIGEWVLRTACRQAMRWLNAGVPDFRMAVNLSVAQLVQPGFVDMVKQALAETGLPPRCLALEVTESVLMEGAGEAESTLSSLRDIGVWLAIDDFGTGYSSFSYLKRFPVDVLKIDYSFTREVTSDRNTASIVTGIIALAHSLGLQVVAEGVETVAQREFVLQQGCDYIQGYLLSKPVPTDIFEQDVLGLRAPEAPANPESAALPAKVRGGAE